MLQNWEQSHMPDWQPVWSPSLIATASYGLAAAAFLLLAVLLLFFLLRADRRERRHTDFLAASCVLSGCWAAGAALSGTLGAPAMLATQLLEVLRTASWLLVLLMLSSGGRRLQNWLLMLGGLALLDLLDLFNLFNFSNPAGAVGYGPGQPAALVSISIRLALAVLGMLLVEHLYRGTQLRARWGIKFVCLSIGCLFAYDFYLYSDALLFRQVNPEIWAARGIVNALSAPLLAIAAARNPVWAPGLSLSRQILFRSAALLGSALYLLAMAASAYYLRYIGGAWGPVMQLACLFGALLLLAGVLFSGAMRARLKVFINKHFYQGRFDYRQEWLRFTRGLAEHGAEHGAALAERSIQAVAELVESPAGALWIAREGGRYQPAASWNMAPQTAEECADSALCRFLAARLWVIDVAECRRHPQRYGGLALPDWLRGVPELWLLVPLMLEGRLFGFIALARPRSSMPLNWEVLDVLKIAGSQAASYLAHRESADSLMVARQFESFNRMSTFIVHDLKNLVSQLSLLLVNAERHKANPAFQADMLETLSHSVAKMKLLLYKLSRGETQEVAAPLQLDQLLVQAVQARAALEPRPVLELRASGLTVLANWQRLERVIGHIIQNAVEATPRNGKVAVRLLQSDQAAVIELSDTGQGMSEQFIRERLFKPFESTKAAGMGIGVFESREYIREVGGRLEVASRPAAGTTFRVILPLHTEAAAAA